LTTDVDVIVVRAGIAGLVAAHELTSRGKSRLIAMADRESPGA
jgi:cation diffusion facilitator CzcD-associated flavoprotein CzcO